MIRQEMSFLETARNYIIEAIPKKYPSTLGFKYPTLRDHPLHSTDLWLTGKQIDDGAEGLWRIHDSLYNLTDFVKEHPGGEEWLTLTRGTDITEAFEVHHIGHLAETTLPKYFVRKVETPRNSPFTFHENGFYKTLKRRVREVLKNVSQEESLAKSSMYADLLVLGYVLCAILASRWWSYKFLIAAAVLLNMAVSSAHNFFHQKDNFRMYYFNLSLMSYRSWRVSHVLSHHLYTNTIKDLEISMFEPFFQYLPQKKHVFFKTFSWFYTPIVYSVLFYGYWLIDTFQRIASLNFSKSQLIPFTVPTLMYFSSNLNLYWIIFMFFSIITLGSFLFGCIGLNAGHHHPSLFHDGDAPRRKEELDWGIHQVDCVMDRPDIWGWDLVVLATFGEHALHHIFPTLDHGVLKHLHQAFEETCETFGVPCKKSTLAALTKGQFLQLSKTIPNHEPPPRLKTT